MPALIHLRLARIMHGLRSIKCAMKVRYYQAELDGIARQREQNNADAEVIQRLMERQKHKARALRDAYPK